MGYKKKTSKKKMPSYKGGGDYYAMGGTKAADMANKLRMMRHGGSSTPKSLPGGCGGMRKK